MRRINPRSLFLVPGITFLALSLTNGQSMAASGYWSTHGPYGGTVAHLAVSEPDPNVVFAGSNAGLHRSTDGGLHWHRSETGLPSSPDVRSISLGTQDPIAFLSASGSLYRSANSGLTWMPVVSPSLPGESIFEVSLRPGSKTDVVFGTTVGAYVSHDGGLTWSGPNPILPAYTLTNVHYAADGAIYLGKFPTDNTTFEAASLLKSTDGGTTWIPLETVSFMLSGTSTIATSPVNPQHVFVLSLGSVQYSLDGGQTWGSVNASNLPGPCFNFNAIRPDPTDARGLFVTCEESLLHTIDATVALPKWTRWDESDGLATTNGSGLDIVNVAAHPDYPGTPRVWVGTLKDGVFLTVNDGDSWAKSNQGLSTVGIRAIAAHPYDAETGHGVIFAGSDIAAPMFKSADSGDHWNDSISGMAAQWIRSITIDPTSVDTDPDTNEAFTIYASGRTDNFNAMPNAGIYKSTNSGASWSPIGQGIALFNGHPDMGVVRNILLDPDSCDTPPCMSGSSPLQTVYVAGSGRPAAVGMPYSAARIYKSLDAGANWVASDTGLPPAQDAGPAGQQEYVADYIVPMAMDPATPSTLYVGTVIDWDYFSSAGLQPTLPNGVFKSVDAGANWEHASNGLPRCGGAGTSHCDVFALAINPANPQIVLAGLVDNSLNPAKPAVYRSVDAGANWALSIAGIAGTIPRSLAFEADGSAAYAGIDGTAANPGGVFRSTDGGLHWNSMNAGLAATSALALSVPPRAPAASSRLLLGTASGVWEHTAVADDDADGVSTAVEDSYPGGDGNGDSIADSIQPAVATLVNASAVHATVASGSTISSTVSIVQAANSCSQLNDVSIIDSDEFPEDIGVAAESTAPWGLIKLALPGCASANVRVTFHGASFGNGWVWRNYGPIVPGEEESFAWYTFAGATRIDTETWELSIDGSAVGNYRNDPVNILFLGGPASDILFANGFEGTAGLKVGTSLPAPPSLAIKDSQ